MKNTVRPSVVLFIFSALLAVPHTLSAQAGDRIWNFDHDTEGKPPEGLLTALTGQGTTGQWVVMKDAMAPSKPHVLAQTSQDKTDYRFPIAIAEGASYRDLALSVRFKAISGSVDQGAGLVFRLKDKDNYYVARANALEDNFRLYHVVNGKRIQFAGANFKVSSQEWHEIKIEVRGDEFRRYYDGQLKISAKDSTFKDAGKVGVWTKADSVIYFDDLTVKDLSGATAALPQGKIYAQQLAEDLAAKHPDLVRIGMHVTPPNKADNIIIACNQAERIGRKSDPEDLEAMTTGQPVVLKEGENFDVTLPLHDASDKTIGAIGLTLKPRSRERDADTTGRARAIAGEIEKQIVSAGQLFESRSES